MLITAPRDCSKATATGRPPKRTAKPPAQSSTASGLLPSWHRSRCPLSRSFTVTACLSIAQSIPTQAAKPSAAYHVCSGIDVLLFLSSVKYVTLEKNIGASVWQEAAAGCFDRQHLPDLRRLDGQGICNAGQTLGTQRLRLTQELSAHDDLVYPTIFSWIAIVISSDLSAKTSSTYAPDGKQRIKVLGLA